MTPRERFLACMAFEPVDRIPLEPGMGRESTRARWHREGLPVDEQDIVAYAYRQAGGRLPPPVGGVHLPVDERMRPQFEERVIERRERSLVVQDWKGNVCEISDEFDISYLRHARDFVTRRWLRCPVEDRDDWAAMQERYDAEDPARLPEDLPQRAAELHQRDRPLSLHFSGPFWQLREWLGFEFLCETFIEDPDWIEEMVLFWQEHVARLIERVCEHVVPDHIHVSEDMAYKAHPMIGPDMTRRFLLPCYQRWGVLLRQYGVPVYGIDSDGDISTLIPVYLEAGVNLVDPMEVAAGIDLPALRERYGTRLAFRGGVDKRAMARGGSSIEAELERLAPVMHSGGYIPGCDHGVPADVSWPDFQHYVRCLARHTGWL